MSVVQGSNSVVLRVDLCILRVVHMASTLAVNASTVVLTPNQLIYLGSYSVATEY